MVITKNIQNIYIQKLRKLDLAVVCFTNPKDELLNKRYFDIGQEF